MDSNGRYATFPSILIDAGGNKVYEFRGYKQSYPRFKKSEMEEMYQKVTTHSSNAYVTFSV